MAPFFLSKSFRSLNAILRRELLQMQMQPAQSNTNSGSYPLADVSAHTGRLTVDEVVCRLFLPATHNPELVKEPAIVAVTAGETERNINRSQLENLFTNALDSLKEHGVKDGDKLLFYSENSPELTSTILACWALNAMVVLVDYRAKREEVLEMSKKLGSKLLLTSRRMYTNFKSETKPFTEAGVEVIDVDEIAELKDKAAKTQVDLQTIDLDRPAFTILTSGTTGKPKISIHTLRSLFLNIIDLAESTDLQEKMTALTPLPISHIFGLTVFLVTQTLGMKTVLTELEPVGFIKAVHRHKPELIAALPQFYGALLAAPKGFVNVSNAHLLLCGGSPLTVSLAQKFEETFGKRLNNGYGSTECKLVGYNIDGPVLSVGKPVGNIKVDIVDEQGEVLPEGTSGEVRIGGPLLMDGYLDNDEETKKVLRGGYYYTGDIGRFENGYLFVSGRKGDFIIVAGAVVQSGQVEEALRNHPQVKDVAVTGMKNNRLGQIVKASVVLVDEKLADRLKSTDANERLEAKRELQNDFKAFCRENLSRYQRPMKWEFIGPHENLPKTLAGKTDKKAMS